MSSVRVMGEVVAVAVAGDRTFGGLDTATVDFYRMGATPDTPYTLVGSLRFEFPETDAAVSITMASRAVSGSPGQYELYFGLQAGNNQAVPVGDVAVTGLVNTALPAGSLYRLEIDTNQPVPEVLSVTQLADGLRNAGGITVDGDGNIYFTDNGYEDALGAMN